MLASKDLCYETGRMAFANGDWLSSNPFRQEGAELECWHAWREGWIAAQAEMETKGRSRHHGVRSRRHGRFSWK